VRIYFVNIFFSLQYFRRRKAFYGTFVVALKHFTLIIITSFIKTIVFFISLHKHISLSFRYEA